MYFWAPVPWALKLVITAAAEEGNEYFVDLETRETTWVRPEAAAWFAEYDNDRQLHYYINEVTNVREGFH